MFETIPVTTALQIQLGPCEIISRCPITGLADHGVLIVEYISDLLTVESFSFKTFLEEWKDVMIYQEHLVPKILDELVCALDPWECSVENTIAPEGGVPLTITANYWRPAS